MLKSLDRFTYACFVFFFHNLHLKLIYSHTQIYFMKIKKAKIAELKAKAKVLNLDATKKIKGGFVIGADIVVA